MRREGLQKRPHSGCCAAASIVGAIDVATARRRSRSRALSFQDKSSLQRQVVREEHASGAKRRKRGPCQVEVILHEVEPHLDRKREDTRPTVGLRLPSEGRESERRGT